MIKTITIAVNGMIKSPNTNKKSILPLMGENCLLSCLFELFLQFQKEHRFVQYVHELHPKLLHYKLLGFHLEQNNSN